MASRESTGIQIGLILSVIVNVGLGVTAFIFQKDIQEAQAKVKSAETARAEAETGKRAAEETSNKVKSIVGAEEKDDAKVLDAKFEEDKKNYADPRVLSNPEAAGKLIYHDLLVAQAAKLASLNDQIAKANADKVVQVAGKEQVVVVKTGEAAKSDAEKNATVVASTQVKAAFDAELAKIREAYLAVEKKYSDSIAKIDKDKDVLKGTITDLQSKLAKAEKLYAESKDMDTAGHQDNFEWSQGKVTYINQLENTCYINLGRDDLLRKGISFNVYPPRVTNVHKATPKGSIEVIDVSEAHVALCRLVHSELHDPILPGDEIYTLAWTPGQHQHFGINGFIDIDGDRVSDRKKVHDLINLYGGIVDAELDEKGSVSGSLTVGTRYLIEGERPNEKSSEQVRIGFSKIHGDAERMRVEVISVEKFLKLVGYVPRTVSAGGSGTAARKAPPKAAPGAAGADAKDSAFKKRAPAAAAPAAE